MGVGGVMGGTARDSRQARKRGRPACDAAGGLPPPFSAEALRTLQCARQLTLQWCGQQRVRPGPGPGGPIPAPDADRR